MSFAMRSSTVPGPVIPGYEEAAALVAAYAAGLLRIERATERLDLASTSGRVLAESICADRDQPPFTRSTRDGFACRAAEASHHKLLKLAGASRAGSAPAGPLPKGAAWEIMTGAPVPEGADSVAMIEHVEIAGEKVRLLAPRTLEAGENIVPQGAQARAGDELLAAGSLMQAQQIALAATCGYATVEVYARPRVAILATGDELVPVDAEPEAGQIRNSNAPMLAAMVKVAGGEPLVLPRAADTAEALDAALHKAAEADLLIISGGVSAGKFDLVEPALERMGARFHFTGVKIQPGKPLVFGELSRKSKAGSRVLPFFGLPGNPVSSAVTFLLFASRVLAALGGNTEPGARFGLARLAAASDKHGKPGLTRFLPAHCSFGGTVPEVELIPWQGSGDLAALARSNCFLVVPEEAHRLEAGAIVRILLTS
jgi:molybdopterin molybdotransferase